MKGYLFEKINEIGKTSKIGIVEKSVKEEKQIIVICPYDIKTLKVCEGLEKVNVDHKLHSKIIILGDETRINNLLNENLIEIESPIINTIDEDDIICNFKARVNSKTITLFGVTNESLQNSILKISNKNNNDMINYLKISNYHIIDFPELRHFVFVSSSSNSRFHVEEKKRGIISICKFMSSLGVHKPNIAMIIDDSNQKDILEVNLTKMIIKDNISINANIYPPCELKEIFNTNYKNNIYDKKINLFLFKNNDVTRAFLNTLNIFSDTRICSIFEYNDMMFIDSSKQKDEQSILFALLLAKRSKNAWKISHNLDSRFDPNLIVQV